MSRYRSLFKGELVESTLKEHVAEHINAEISLGNIKDVAQALEWVRDTYMYVRMVLEPGKYGIPARATATTADVDTWI